MAMICIVGVPFSMAHKHDLFGKQMSLGLGVELEPEQLTLFSGRGADTYAIDDFFVSESNQSAFDLVLSWPNWSAHGCVLVGPTGSGKSHLGHIWAHKAQASIFLASEFSMSNLQDLGHEHSAVMIDQFDAKRCDEDALFHLLNRVRAGEMDALVVASTAPEEWGLEREDLLSRIRLLPRAQMLEVDETLMRMVLVKLFQDRGILPEPEWVEMMSQRLPRSLGVARAFVENLDDISLRRQSKISKTLIHELLVRFEVL